MRSSGEDKQLMQLKMTTDYALRAVLYLASTQRVTTAAEIAENMNIPKNYLINLISALRKAGIVGTHVGLYGGYFLQCSPEQVTMYDVISVTEGTIKLCRCLDEESPCMLNGSGTCPVHATYLPIQNAIENVLRNTTIKDLLDGNAGDKVQELLHPQA